MMAIVGVCLLGCWSDDAPVPDAGDIFRGDARDVAPDWVPPPPSDARGDRTVFQSYEGQFCSDKEDDDPFYECTTMFPFVCINTYSVPMYSGAGAVDHVPLYLCRLACTTDQSCPVANDVCCPGPIFGRTYGVTHACVPRAMCAALGPGTAPDGGADAPSRELGGG